VQYICGIRPDELTYSCQCIGTDYNGMPDISLRVSDNSQINLSADQYMMFPAVDDSTKETVCAFGLFNRLQYNINREIYVLG